MEGKYYITHYLQKSQIMLLPLVEKSSKAIHMQSILGTYLHWEEIDEDILDNKLLVEYTNDCDYGGNEHTIAAYSTEDSSVLVYDLNGYSEDVQHFLNGEYSKYSERVKEKILDYLGFKKGAHPQSLTPPHWAVILYPEMFMDSVAADLVDTFKYFDTKKEARQQMKAWGGQLLPMFDTRKETLTKKRIE